MINGDFAPLPENLKEALDTKKDQLKLAPGIGDRYIALNTTMKPFDDLNVRKAVLAGFDRNALRLTRGGPTIGDIATHFLAPGHRRLRRGGRHEGHRRRLPVGRTASPTWRRRPSTSRRRASPPASTRAPTSC